MRDDRAEFEAADVAVFGISGGGMKSHERFSRTHGFQFPLLADKGNKVALAYDSRRLRNLFPVRTVVGIDKQGVIVYYQRGMPTTDEILAGIAGAES